jgi:hypothetical protein
MTSNITIAKGVYSVTIHTTEIVEDYANDLHQIVIPTTKQNQANGPKNNKTMDMLKITHSVVVRGYLSTELDRTNLIKIFKGAEIAGSPVAATYDTHPDTPLNMFMEKLMITEASKDKLSSNQTKYAIQVTLLEGVSS